MITIITLVIIEVCVVIILIVGFAVVLYSLNRVRAVLVASHALLLLQLGLLLSEGSLPLDILLLLCPSLLLEHPGLLHLENIISIIMR